MEEGTVGGSFAHSSDLALQAAHTSVRGLGTSFESKGVVALAT